MKKLNFPNLSPTLGTEAWTTPENAAKPMDTELATAFTEIIDREISKPNLGCATTGQLLDELRARVDLNYSTVFYDESLQKAQCPTTPAVPAGTPPPTLLDGTAATRQNIINALFKLRDGAYKWERHLDRGFKKHPNVEAVLKFVEENLQFVEENSASLKPLKD